MEFTLRAQNVKRPLAAAHTPKHGSETTATVRHVYKRAGAALVFFKLICHDSIWSLEFEGNKQLCIAVFVK